MIVRDLLTSHPFVADLPGRDLDRLACWTRRTVFHAGRRVCEEGSRADRFWLIREGQIAVVSATLSGRPAHLQTLTGGDVLGWSWLVPPYRWRVGATAVQPTLALELDAHGVRELCDSNPRLGYELSRRFHLVMANQFAAVRTLALSATEASLDRELSERQLSLATMDRSMRRDESTVTAVGSGVLARAAASPSGTA